MKQYLLVETSLDPQSAALATTGCWCLTERLRRLVTVADEVETSLWCSIFDEDDDWIQVDPIELKSTFEDEESDELPPQPLLVLLLLLLM